MSVAESSDLAEILTRVTSWPADRRIALARRILESLEPAPPPPESEPMPTAEEIMALLHPERYGRRIPTAEELQAMLGAVPPGPDDATVKRWIDEHRMTKYGQ